MGAVSKHDLGHTTECRVQVGLGSDADVLSALVLHTDTDHGDHNRREDTQEG